MKTKIAGIVGALFLSTVASMAHADVYTWKITGGFTGSGSFTTQVTPSDSSGADDPNTGLAYLLTSFTGTFGGKTVELASDPSDIYGADDLFYPTGYYPYVDLDGLLFETLSSGGALVQEYNLFDSQTCTDQGADTQICSQQALIGFFGTPGVPNSRGGGSKTVTFSFTDTTPPAVPEPASLAVLGVGLAGLGFQRRRKRAQRFSHVSATGGGSERAAV